MKAEKFFGDNDERAIFFGRGVLETVKKLGWTPDVIHCHGWMSALMPLYIRKMYGNDPHFADTKIVYSAYNQGFDGELDGKLTDKLKFDGFEDKDIESMKAPSMDALHKLAIDMSDGVVFGSEDIDSGLNDYVSASGKLFLPYQGESNYVSAYSEFYDQVIESNSVLVD